MSRSYIFVKLRDKNGDTPEERKFRKICEQILIKNYKKSSAESPEDKFRKLSQGFLFEDLTLKTNTLDDFDELGSNQDYSNLFKSLEEKPTEEGTEESEAESDEEIDYTGAKTGEGMFNETEKQQENFYSDLSNKKDRTLFQNWYMINNILLNHQDESALVPPKGVEKTDPAEFLKSIDLTGIAEDLETKTALPGDEPGPTVEPVAFNRDENDRVSAYDIIDQYISDEKDPDSQEEGTEIGTQPTGINALGDYFNQVRDKITAKYNTLTSDPKQRAAFIKTYLTLSKAKFDEMDAKLENPGVSTEE